MWRGVMGWCWIYRHFVHVLFERLICAGLKRNSIEDLEKNSGENVLLKNTMQVQQTCVKNHQFLKIEQKIPCWDISGFFFTKKNKEREKMFQTCSVNMRATFFHDFFFCWVFAKINPAHVRRTYAEFYPTLLLASN